MTGRIYADHAATTPLMPEALEAMLPFLKEDFGNPSSLHGWAKPARKAIDEARAAIAKCINAEPEEIFFTSGGTEADNWVVKSLGRHGAVTSMFEHHAVLNSFASFGDKQQTYFLKPNRQGVVSASDLPSAFDRFGCVERPPCLVSIMTANNEIGTIQPIKELVSVSHEWGHLFHTDAVQAVGHIPIDVREMGVDFLSASAHKFNGPKGIGFLFIRKGVKIDPLIDGGRQENGLRAGTENVASIVGMATALKLNCERMDGNAEHLENLTLRLRDGIDRIFPNAIYLGDGVAGQLPGFTSVSFPGHPAEGLMHMLDLKGIAVSTGAACDSKNTQISHVLKAINATNEIARSTIRITLGPENTVDDIDAILAALKRILREGGK